MHSIEWLQKRIMRVIFWRWMIMPVSSIHWEFNLSRFPKALSLKCFPPLHFLFSVRFVATALRLLDQAHLSLQDLREASPPNHIQVSIRPYSHQVVLICRARAVKPITVACSIKSVHRPTAFEPVFALVRNRTRNLLHVPSPRTLPRTFLIDDHEDNDEI